MATMIHDIHQYGFSKELINLCKSPEKNAQSVSAIRRIEPA